MSGLTSCAASARSGCFGCHEASMGVYDSGADTGKSKNMAMLALDLPQNSQPRKERHGRADSQMKRREEKR